MLQKFIERPVLSTVISILIVIMGLVGLVSLPIQQYPDIAPPTIEVSASYPGANADVVLNSVIAPLEEQINGVEGMTYMISSAKNDGTASIQIFFTLDTDPDMAAVNVQNRVAAASSNLPTTVTAMGVSTRKKQNSMILAMSVYSDNPDHDETFIQNYTKINIVPELQRVNGVGDVSVFGARDFSMRVWLKPEKMKAYNLQPSDITAVIKEQSVEVAPGKLGANSQQVFQYTIKYKGRLSTAAEYENIVIRVGENGEILRLRDVADIEFGAFNYDVSGTTNGVPSATLAIYQMKGSNSQEICDNIKTSMTELEKSFPSGFRFVYVVDSQDFLNASIHEVVKTLIEAFILVFIVVFVFLQNVKATVIPAISASVAIVGTFFFLSLLGFSINMLTLFALVLSIGIVVDDAIVVVEAVYAKLENSRSMTTLTATKSAMGEITGAVISITLVFLATFLPSVFMSGATGAFYQQFCITLAIAVCISAVNALTLSPALCVILIKNEGHEEQKQSKLKKLGTAFNTAFEKMTDKYAGVIRSMANRKGVVMLVFAAIVGVAVFLMTRTPTAFVPTEDQGIVFLDLSMPEGTTVERTQEVLAEVDKILAAEPTIEARVNIAGTSMLSGAVGGSYGLGMIKLVHWDKREDISLPEIIGSLQQKMNQITKDATIILFVPPTISGYGSSDGFEFQLKDKTGTGDLNNLYLVGRDFIAEIMKQPEIKYATSSFSVSFPQYEMEVDINKCKMLGVSVSDVFNVMQGYIGGSVTGDFTRFTKFYRVMVQGEADSRTNSQSLGNLYVRSKDGEMVALNTIVTLKRVFGSDLIKRYNMYNAIAVTGQPAEGYSSGQAREAIERAKASLPAGFDYDYTGMTRDEIESGGQQGFVLALSFILVFFILAALYESYILPLSVMLSLLLGVFGVYTAINIFGISANIYVQIALIMLLGLLAKNAILIVEFAKLGRENGLPIVEAAYEAAKSRVRPILMTSFAFIFGMIPLCLSSGAGAAGNISIGITAAVGFLIATILGLFFVP
ncbi:efflux RND transporter permease subunit, partial [Bacteroidales bacterium OttesenSCG-928-E04]|nr:efflux RND transporter permease subunit [Bacteroidales bacterium OttesenSCG-928-E04]